MTPKQLIESAGNLATLPAVFNQVMDAINDPNRPLSDVERILKSDPALTAQILKVVNSPFYGFSEPVGDIENAIGILGSEQLCNLVLSTTIISKFKNIPENLVTMDSFWAHGVATGLAATLLASRLNVGEAGVLYTGGMIHDVSLLIIYKMIPEQATQTLERCNEWGQRLVEAEREVMGFTHEEVGLELTRSWNLPEKLQEITGYTHRPHKAPNHPRLVAMVHVADYIAKGCLLGSSGEHQTEKMSPKLLQNLEITEEILKEVSLGTLDMFNEIFQIFNPMPA